MTALFRFAAALLVLLSPPVRAAPLLPEHVPEPLRPWIPWVLHGHQMRDCPFPYNQPDARRCHWPSRLSLALDGRGGHFDMTIRVYAAGWTALPGDAGHWPQAVTEERRPLLVTAAERGPRVWLETGVHRITGAFRWDRLPETLTVPRDTGLLDVHIDGRELPFPGFNDQGQLWLHTAAMPSERRAAENRLEFEVFRRIVDERPTQIVTRIEIRAAGLPREVVLGGTALPDAVPLQISSPLPARAEPDGTIRMQVRPGTWTVEMTARYLRAIGRLTLPSVPEPWPAQEIWSFDARSHLRMVQIEGPAAIDPRQTNLPEDWQALPAYRMTPGDVMEFRVLRRGDPEPEPDRLQLDRSLWLDFEGKGYTVSDTITGTMTRNWRLDAEPGLRLGRVSLDGQPQPITRLAAGGAEGVEVRRGALQLSADSRFEGGRSEIPATGWMQDFQHVRARLNLPPGWRLLATTGVDNAPETWVGRWTLLDLFVVLIASLAAARLWNWAAGALMLIGLSLLWHEPEAPRFVWLNLLVAIALLRVVPEGRLATTVRVFRNLCFAGLILIVIPFAYNQVRWGLYPQLEFAWQQPGVGGERAEERMEAASEAPMDAELASPAGSAMEAAPDALSDYASRAAKRYATPAAEPKPVSPRPEIDPRAITQTGPGVPRWQWKTVSLSWNGPVVEGQQVGLFLLSPAINLLLNVARVLFVLVLAARLIGFRKDVKGAGLLLFLPLMFGPAPGARADFPSPALLEQLSRNLLEPPECLPSCAAIVRLELAVTERELTQTLELHALQRVSVPLPVQDGQWLPERATIDGNAVDALVRDQDGGMRLGVEAGHHQVTLTGRLPSREQLQLPLPLRPQAVAVHSAGWRVEGVREDGVPDSQLRLVRLSAVPGDALRELVPRPLEAFVRVERTLHIGLDWRVATQVRRLSPSDQPVSLQIPLLNGEAVTTAGVPARDGQVSVNLPPGADILEWASMLEPRAELPLRAPETERWVETWRLDVSPIWHMAADGLAAVHHQDAEGNWLPEWQPWPGEQVTLHFVRPIGAPGNTLTIDDSHVELSPGRRATDGVLSLTLRSAQGAQHRVQLPEGAVLLSAAVDGRAQPIRQQGRSVTLPVHPGRQQIVLNWRLDQPMRSLLRSPAIDLGAASVNHRITVQLGRDRWLLLLGGPKWGPAVLYWGLLAVIGLVAWALGRITWTPLRTRSWLLLLIGLSQIPVAAGAVVVAWLLALGQRARRGQDISDRHFNLMQAALGVLTVLALLLLILAVQQGLLGYPEMQVAGNGSDATRLQWYQDRCTAEPPQAWLVSVPLWVYRLAMLAWALWLAQALLNWLRWGWTCYAAGGLWRRRIPGTGPMPGKPGAEVDPWVEEKRPAPE